MDENIIITLIGIRMAKKGNEFIFKGKSPDCNNCKLRNTCLNLELGRRYQIVGVRDAPALECSIHDGGVQAVEVVEAPLTVIIESRKAFDGSTIVYEPINCDEQECKLFKLCQSSVPIPGNKYTIIKVVGEPEEKCIKEYTFKIVEMKQNAP